MISLERLDQPGAQQQVCLVAVWALAFALIQALDSYLKRSGSKAIRCQTATRQEAPCLVPAVRPRHSAVRRKEAVSQQQPLSAVDWRSALHPLQALLWPRSAFPLEDLPKDALLSPAVSDAARPGSLQSQFFTTGNAELMVRAARAGFGLEPRSLPVQLDVETLGPRPADSVAFTEAAGDR